jgi:polysaccharide biosynthesis transport protein
MSPLPMSDPNAAEERFAWRDRMRTRWSRYRSLVRRRWWVVATTVIAGLMLQAGVLHFEKPRYSSLGRMIVNVKLAIPEGSLYTEELNNFLGTQAALMQSAAVLERARERAHALNQDSAPVTLKVFIQPKTTIFLMQGTGEDGGLTQRFVQACMEEYINFKKEMRAQTSDMTLAGMTEEIARLERELRRCDAELVGFQSSNSVVLLEEQGNSAGNFLAGLNQRVAGMKSERALLECVEPEQILEQPRGLGAATAVSDGTVSGVGGAGLVDGDYLHSRQQVLVLRAEREELAGYLRPRHPRMTVLVEEIARRERGMEILREQAAQQIGRRKELLDVQIRHLEADAREWDARALEVSRKSAEFQRLKSNAQRTQALYDRMLGTLQTLDVNKQISPESVTIMERACGAVLERRGAGARLGLGAAAGLAAGVLLLGLAERLDDRFVTLSEVRELFGEAVLGHMPYERLAGAGTGAELAGLHETRPGWGEAYRTLRGSMLCLGEGRGRARTVLVTSSVPGEGKSVTAAHLGICFARAGARVLLIDADLRKGVLHRMFGCAGGTSGLAEVLRTAERAGAVENGAGTARPGGGAGSRGTGGVEDGISARGVGGLLAGAVRSTGIGNLWLLPCGEVGKDSGELLLGREMGAILEEASRDYEVVLVDSAPVVAGEDAARLGRLAGGVLFVVRAEETSARVARAALELLRLREARVLGLVFNGMRGSDAEYYRHYDAYHAAGNPT